MGWVVIASYSFPYEAQIAKARLNSVDIPSMIENEHTINLNWTYSNALGGVRLAVPESYIEDAKFLLENDFSKDLAEELNSPNIVCPFCESELVEPYTQGKQKAFLMFVLVGFPLFKHKHGYKCKNCNAFFEHENTR